MHIVELQRKLMDNRRLQIEQEQQLENERQYILRTTAIERAREAENERQKRTMEMDIIQTLNEGYNVHEASEIHGIPPP